MKSLVAILLVLNAALAYWWLTTPTGSEQPEGESVHVEVLSCYAVNIYQSDKLASLREAVEKLEGEVAASEFSQWVDGDKWWVVSEAQASQTLTDYRRVVTSAFEIDEGPKTGHYSLGIFSSRQNAVALQSQLAAQSLKTQLLLYQLKKPAWYVVIRVRQAEWLINRYQLEFIEKKSC